MDSGNLAYKSVIHIRNKYDEVTHSETILVDRELLKLQGNPAGLMDREINNRIKDITNSIVDQGLAEQYNLKVDGDPHVAILLMLAEARNGPKFMAVPLLVRDYRIENFGIVRMPEKEEKE